MASTTSAVVVGAGPGLGAAVARRFAKGGFPVALVTRSAGTTANTVKQIEQAGGKAVAYTADATNPAEVNAVVGRIREDLGDIGVLVYNAASGSWPPPALEDTTLDQFKAGLEVAATGAFIWCKAVVPVMKSRGAGTLLFTGATGSLRGGARFCTLSPGKFALRSLSQVLARELQPCGIHVAHVIVDGLIDGPRTQQLAGPAAGDDTRLQPDAIADTYWALHCQHRSAWTQELDLRPYSEKF